MASRTVFAQLCEHLPRYEFSKIVALNKGDHRIRSFTSWEHLLVLIFAQLTARDSLRSIECCLKAHARRLYHSGIRSQVRRSTLSDAFGRRPYRMYEQLALHLAAEARGLYAPHAALSRQVDGLVYAFDSTTIDLCLKLFPWALFRSTKAAVKLHVLLEVGSSVPTFVALTQGRVADMNLLDELPLEAGAFYLLDRGYYSFARLHRIEQQRAYFITRAKRGFAFTLIETLAPCPEQGIVADELVRPANHTPARLYPSLMRRIVYVDQASGRRLVFITNHLILEAATIAALYRQRWQVELFFKWIKQRLQIKRFYGNCINAVRLQIYGALCAYLLVAISRKHLCLESHSMYTFLQVISSSLFEQVAINELFNFKPSHKPSTTDPNQLTIFDF